MAKEQLILKLTKNAREILGEWNLRMFFYKSISLKGKTNYLVLNKGYDLRFLKGFLNTISNAI